MIGYKEIKLGNIAKFKYGTMPKKDKLGKGRFPTFSGYKYQFLYPEYNCEKGDVIVVARGVGGTGDVKMVREKCYLTNLSIIIKLNPEFVNNKYFYYYFLKTTLRYLDSGSAQSQITINDLEKITINIPDLPTQNAVAEILSSLDDKIELNNKINKELENLAQTLFKQWFVDFEFPNENGEPYKSSGGEMVDSELGEIPKEWKIVPLNDILELIIDYRGKTPLKLGMTWVENGIKAISAKNVKNRSLVNLDNVHKGSPKLFEVWMKDKLNFADILLTSEAPLGETALLLNDHNYILSQRLFALRVNQKTSPYFLFEYLSSDLGKNELERRQSGSTVVGIKQKELLEIKLVSPSNGIIRLHSDKVCNLYNLIESNRLENEQLIKLRDIILPKLISGELEIKEITN